MRNNDTILTEEETRELKKLIDDTRQCFSNITLQMSKQITDMWELIARSDSVRKNLINNKKE